MLLALGAGVSLALAFEPVAAAFLVPFAVAGFVLTTRDLPATRAWLREVAQKAAEAGNEGGFLGFGGVAVSDAEKATLSEISTALGSSANPQAGIAET